MRSCVEGMGGREGKGIWIVNFLSNKEKKTEKKRNIDNPELSD